MSYTTPATELILKKWETDYFSEYVRESGFMPYMGAGSNSPFVVKKQLIQGGQVITIPLVEALTGNNVGTGTLTGTGTFGSIDNLQGRLIDQTIIEGLEADANFLVLHKAS